MRPLHCDPITLNANAHSKPIQRGAATAMFDHNAALCASFIKQIGQQNELAMDYFAHVGIIGLIPTDPPTSSILPLELISRILYRRKIRIQAKCAKENVFRYF